MSKNALLAAIEEHDAKFIDLRFSDMLGKEQHITLPVSAVDDDLLEHGKTIDHRRFFVQRVAKNSSIRFDIATRYDLVSFRSVLSR